MYWDGRCSVVKGKKEEHQIRKESEEGRMVRLIEERKKKKKDSRPKYKGLKSNFIERGLAMENYWACLRETHVY